MATDDRGGAPPFRVDLVLRTAECQAYEGLLHYLSAGPDYDPRVQTPELLGAMSAGGLPLSEVGQNTDPRAPAVALYSWTRAEGSPPPVTPIAREFLQGFYVYADPSWTSVVNGRLYRGLVVYLYFVALYVMDTSGRLIAVGVWSADAAVPYNSLAWGGAGVYPVDIDRGLTGVPFMAGTAGVPWTLTELIPLS